MTQIVVIKVCRKLILQYIKDDEKMKAIAFFYLLKLSFPNSRIYNNSVKTIHDRTLRSNYLIKKYIKILISIGLIWYENDMIVLKPLDEIKKSYKERHKVQILINKSESLKNIVFRLKVVCVENYLQQQRYVVNCKIDQKFMERDDKTVFTIERVKEVQNICKNTGATLRSKLILSARKASKLFGINPDDFRLFREFTFEHFNWLWKSERTKRISNFREFDFSIYRSIYTYYYKGFIIQQAPYTVTLNTI